MPKEDPAERSRIRRWHVDTWNVPVARCECSFTSRVANSYCYALREEARMEKRVCVGRADPADRTRESGEALRVGGFIVYCVRCYL